MRPVSMVLSLLPFVIISAMLAWGNYFLAVKSGRSAVLYVILAFIPLVGFIATGYLIYTSLYRALDQKRAARWRSTRMTDRSPVTPGVVWRPFPEPSPYVSLTSPREAPKAGRVGPFVARSPKLARRCANQEAISSFSSSGTRSRISSGIGNGGLPLSRNSTVVNNRSVSPMFSTE